MWCISRLIWEVGGLCVPDVCTFIHHMSGPRCKKKIMVRTMSCAISYSAQNEEKLNHVNFHHAKIAFKCMSCKQTIKLEYGIGALQVSHLSLTLRDMASTKSCTAANVLQMCAFRQTSRLQLSSPQTEMHLYVQAAYLHKPEKWGWRKSSHVFWGLWRIGWWRWLKQYNVYV